MVNSGSFDADGQGDRNAKAGCTQPHNSVSSDSTQTSSPVTTSDIASCNSGLSSRTADSDLPAIGPTPTKTEINCAMPIENNSNDFFAKERSDDEKSRTSTSSTEEKTSLCCSLPLDKVQGVLTPFHQFRSDDDFALKAKPTRKLLCLYCDRSFVSANLRQKHVERIHSVKQNRRVSSRRHNQLTVTPCVYCDKLNSTENTLKDLFYHLVNEHSTKYFGCLPCEDRFLSSSLLADHNASSHQETVSPQASTPVSSISSISKTPSPEEETIESADSQDEEVTVKVTRSQVKPKIEDDGKIEPKKKVAKLKELRNKKLSVKSSRIALKRRESKRLQAIAKLSECQKKKRTKPSERKLTAVPVKPEQINSTKSTEKVKTTPSCVNPYPEFDCFYRVKKITDHSIDNLKISSLTFDDVFDKAFFNRIKCNIEENLLHHIDGKLFKNEESENRISNFEKVSNISQETQNSSSENYGCEISLNAVTPVASLSLNSQYGEDFESQIEYGSKPSKKKTQSKTDEVHYKYFTRRKFQASILEHKENRDLSKLDMWTQLVIKKRQQKMLDEKKTPKEMLEYTAGDEYKSKIKREELNRILDRRGPFEDLKEEASKKVALDKLNSASEDNISHESFTEVREVLNDILNRVFATTESSDSTQEIETEKTSNKKQDLREIPCYLSLRRTSSLPSEGEIDRSDKITLICSSQETENFELPTNQVRDKNELIELSGEWARCRMYICAACGAKLPNMKYLLEHKSIYHQNVWVQHYEFVGNQSELYRHLSIPALGKIGRVEESIPCKVWKRSEARLCTKCGKQCNSLGELHRHILECGGDWTWMLARKKCKYRPYGARSRRKRRGLVHRVHLKQKTEPTEKKKYKKKFQGPRQRPSDADTIQRMLANLPAKRSTRKLISLQDGIYRARKKTQINSQLKSNINMKKVKCGKVIYQSSSIKENTEKTINTRVTTNLPKNNMVTRRTLRSISKVLSSRIIDTNTKLTVRRKLKAINERRRTRQSQNIVDNKNENEVVGTATPKSTQKSNNHKENIVETLTPKRTSPRSSPKNMTKVTVKKLLTGKINIKSFFPIKKQKKSSTSEVHISEEETVVESQDKVKVKKKSKDIEDIKIDQKVTNECDKVEQKKIKNSTLGKLVKSLNINSKKKSNKKSDPHLTQLPLEKDKTLSNENSEIVSNSESKIITIIENVIKQTSEKVNKTVEVNNKKRKLKNNFQHVINKVKKSKIESISSPQPCIEPEKVCENTQFNSEDAFLGKSKENDTIDPPEQPEKIVIPSTSDTQENVADISEAVPIVMKFNETNENPPILETIFKLESNNEKNLQAKGELDFDTQPNIVIDNVNETNEIIKTTTKEEIEPSETDEKEVATDNLPEQPSETMQPISIETSDKPKSVPLISPNMKGKIRKPTRGLNDCIAMLTSKLQQKTNENDPKIDRVLDLSPTSNVVKPIPDLILPKPDCILKIPTFKMPLMDVEETALDLSMKSKSNRDLTKQRIENVFRSNCLTNKDIKWKAHSTNRIFNSVDQTIEDVIGNRILPILTIKSQNMWSSVDETIQNVIDNHKEHMGIQKTIDFSKTSVDDIIEFVITTSKKMHELNEETPILEEKSISTLLSKKIKAKTFLNKGLSDNKKEDTQQKNEGMLLITNIEINVNNEVSMKNTIKLDRQDSVKKRGRPKKVNKLEPELILSKTAIVDNTEDRLQGVQFLVDDKNKINTENLVAANLAEQNTQITSNEKMHNNEIANGNQTTYVIPTPNVNIENTISIASDSSDITVADKFKKSVVISSLGIEPKEVEKVITCKNKKASRIAGRVKSKFSTKKEKQNQENSIRPVIETNIDSLVGFEEVKKTEISTALTSVNDGQKEEMKLLNEDEPQLLESKSLVTEKKSDTLLSDPEDDLPLAVLAKSDEKSLDEEVNKFDRVNIEENLKNSNCDKYDEFIGAQLVKKSVKNVKRSSKIKGVLVNAINETVNETGSEMKETDNFKVLHTDEKNADKISTLTENETIYDIDDKTHNDTQNVQNKQEHINNYDISKDNSTLDQLHKDDSNKKDNVNLSNGKLKTHKKLINKKQKLIKSKVRKVTKKSQLSKGKQQITQEETKQIDNVALETSLNVSTVMENLSKPAENSLVISDHIFKTPLKRIKSSKRSKNIKRSKSLGDISNSTMSNFENQLEKSASLKDVSSNTFSEVPKEQAKENKFDSDTLDTTRSNGSIYNLLTNPIQTNSLNTDESCEESKTNLRNIRKQSKNSKKSESEFNKAGDTEEVINISLKILGAKLKANGRNRRHSIKKDPEKFSDAFSSSSLLENVENSKVSSLPDLTSNKSSNENINKNASSTFLTRNASVLDFSESSNSFLDSSSDLDYSLNTSDKADTETTDTSDFFSSNSTSKKTKCVYKRSKSRKKNRLKFNTKTNSTVKSLSDTTEINKCLTKNAPLQCTSTKYENTDQLITVDSCTVLNAELGNLQKQIESESFEKVHDIPSKVIESSIDSVGEFSLNKNKKVHNIKKRGRKAKSQKRRFFKKMNADTSVTTLQTLNENQVKQVKKSESNENDLNSKKLENEVIVLPVDIDVKPSENVLTSEGNKVIESEIKNLRTNTVNEIIFDNGIGEEHLKLTKSRGKHPKSHKFVSDNDECKPLIDQIEDLEVNKRIGSLRNKNKTIEMTEISQEIVDSKDSSLSETSVITNVEALTKTVDFTKKGLPILKSRSSRRNKGSLITSDSETSLSISDIKIPLNISENIGVLTEEQIESQKDNVTEEISSETKRIVENQIKQSNKKKKSNKQSSKTKKDNLEVITNSECSTDLGDIKCKSEIRKNNNLDIIPKILQNKKLDDLFPASTNNQNLKKGKKPKVANFPRKNIKNPSVDIPCTKNDFMSENESLEFEDNKVVSKTKSKNSQHIAELKENELDTTIRRPRSARNKKINYVETNENEDDIAELEDISSKEKDNHKQQKRSKSGRRNINPIDDSENDNIDISTSLPKETEEEIKINPIDTSVFDNKDQLNGSIPIIKDNLQADVLEKCKKLTLELTIPLPVETTPFEINKKSIEKIKRHQSNKKTKITSNLLNTDDSAIEDKKNQISAITENNEDEHNLLTTNNSVKDNEEIITSYKNNDVTKNILEKSELENNHEPPIKLIINKQKTRRKSKSFRKIDLKGQNDLYQDFALVIKKPKRILPIITFCNDNFMKDTYPNYLKKQDVSQFLPLAMVSEEKGKIKMVQDKEKVEASLDEKTKIVQNLDASIEEMDMELDEIPITSNIIERNDFSFDNINENSIFNKDTQQAILKIPKKTHKTRNRRINKKKSKTSKSDKNISKNLPVTDKYLKNDGENTLVNPVYNAQEETGSNIDKYSEVLDTLVAEDKLTVHSKEQNYTKDDTLKSVFYEIDEIDISERFDEKSLKNGPVLENITTKRKSKKNRVSKKKQLVDINVPELMENTCQDDIVDMDKDENLAPVVQVTNSKKSSEKDVDSIYTFTELEDFEIEKPIELPRFTRKQSNILQEGTVDSSKQLEDNEIVAYTVNEKETLNQSSEFNKTVYKHTEIQTVSQEAHKDTLKSRSNSRKGNPIDIVTSESTIEGEVIKVSPLKIISKKKSKSSKQINSDMLNSVGNFIEDSEEKFENERFFIKRSSRRKPCLISEDISNNSINLDYISEVSTKEKELNVSRRKFKYNTFISDDSILETSEENVEDKEKTTPSFHQKIMEPTNESYNVEPIHQERLTFKLPSRIKCKFNKESTSDSNFIDIEPSEDDSEIKPDTRTSKFNKDTNSDVTFDYETLTDDIYNDFSSRPSLRRKSKSSKEIISDLESSNVSDKEKNALPKQSSKKKSKSKKTSVSNVANSLELNKKETELMVKLYSDEQLKFDTKSANRKKESSDVKDSCNALELLNDFNNRKEPVKSTPLQEFGIDKEEYSVEPVFQQQQDNLLDSLNKGELLLKSRLMQKSGITKMATLDVDFMDGILEKQEQSFLTSKSKKQSKSSLNDSISEEINDLVMEQELVDSLIESSLKPDSREIDFKYLEEISLPVVEDTSKKELPLKSTLRRKSKISKEISDSLELAPNKIELSEEFLHRSVSKRKSKNNREVISDMTILDVSSSSLNVSPLIMDDSKQKPTSKRTSKSAKDIILDNKDILEFSNPLDVLNTNIKQIVDTDLTENSMLNSQLINDIETSSIQTESVWGIEDENGAKTFSLKSIIKRKPKLNKELSSSIVVSVETNITVDDKEIISNTDILNEHNSEVAPIKVTKKKTKNNKLFSKSTDICSDLTSEVENIEIEGITMSNKNANVSSLISLNIEVGDQPEIEKTQEQIQKQVSKKRSKFTREMTLEDIQENLSNGAIKENNLNIEDVGRRKSVRSAKVKALEHIHDEALAELTESERNRDLEKTTLDNSITDSKKSVSKKSKKSHNMTDLMDNFDFRQKILEEEKSPLFADLVADLAGLEELENSIERELNAEMNEKEENSEIQENIDSINFEKKQESENTDFTVQDGQELRRSRRESRKVTSYNENDLIDPLLDIIDGKKKNKKKDDRASSSENKITKKTNKELEKKLNSDELFDLLKASTTEQIYMPKPQNSFLTNLDDSSRDFNIDEHFDSVFDNAIEKSTLLVSSTNTDKHTNKNYEFSENSEYNEQKELSFVERKKSGKRGKRNSSSLKASIEESSDSISNNQELPVSEESSKIEKDDSNYCDICNKSFIRLENLIKHKRTLTHIQKLSELEAKEAEEKSKLEQITNELNDSDSVCDISAEIPDGSKNSLESSIADINIHNILLESEKPGNHSQIVHSAFTNNDSLKLADIISDVLNKPVLQSDTEESNNFTATQSEIQTEYKRYKSLGERKSFDSDKILLPNDSHILPISEPYISKTTILEKQISLLENIIESQSRVNYIDDISMSSNNSVTEVNENSDISKLDMSVSKSSSKPLSDNSFLKPTQYEEISEDSINLRNYEDQKLRKTLNRDEELFLECCSLLKSGSEVSSYSNQRSQKVSNSLNLKQYDEPESTEEKAISQNSNCELEDDYSDDNSRIPTPLGDSYDDDASDSNTISSNWDINKMAPVFEDKEENIGPTLTFQEVLNTTGQNNKFGSTIKKSSKQPKLELEGKLEEGNTDVNDGSFSDSKKIITKGARKVFEGLKVSIPTEELNLEEVLNCSPKVNKTEILNKSASEDHTVPDIKNSPPKPSRTARKSKPVKKSQVGSALLFKMNKKKMVSPPINSPSKQTEDELAKSYDVYDFEETQDNTEVFTKPDFKTFRLKKPNENADVESDSENRDDDLGSFVAEAESVTSSISSSSSLKKPKTQENITKKKCMIMGRIFKSQARSKLDDIDEEMREIPIIDNDELVENYVATCKKIIKNEMKPKLSETEINQLFDQLLENKNTDKKSDNSTLTKTTTKSKQETKKEKIDNKKKKVKTKKRARTNSDSTDDEFNLNKTTKRSYKKNCKAEDNCINLEQELKECIGVASRKSQRKCTSGKQNVLVEYWSSDDSQFEALLESQKIEIKPKQPEERKEVEALQIIPTTLEEEIEAKLNEKSVPPTETLTKPKNQEKRPQHRKKSTSEKKEKMQFVETDKTEAMLTNRRKRAAANPLYHWSSSSEDESQDLIKVKPLREEEEDEDRPIQHGWIVGDSPKKLVTMLAQAKGKKTDIDCVKEQGKKRTNTVS